MKLYYMPGACSLSPHIALREAGLDFELVRVGRDKKTEDGQDYLAINPFGYVPALQLDDGQVLAEGPAIVQYIADLRPASGLAPANGTMDRYRLQGALAFISSELHKTVGNLFNPALADVMREAVLAKLDTRLGQLSVQMGDREWLVGDKFTVADAYLHAVLSWLPGFNIDLGKWPVLAAHQARVAARPSVIAAREAEKGHGKKA
jgi:glutathione S-transferase